MDEYAGAAINWASVRPPVAISACLLGERVRHDGGEKWAPWTRELGAFVTWLSLCPEHELGLGVPREPIQIEIEAGAQRLRGVESRRDLTEQMRRFAGERVGRLKRARVCGMVTKSKSPSCAFESTPLIESDRESGQLVSGFFVQELRLALPDLPIMQESDLESRTARESFLTQVRQYYRNLAGIAG